MTIVNFSPCQDYLSLVEECKRDNKLFTDDEFPASNFLLTDSGEAGVGQIITYFGRTRYVAEDIKWMRPHEICKTSGTFPEMIVGKRDRFDINQGDIGDCWFLAALANLAENEELFRTVLPHGQTFNHQQYFGIFRFRFYRFGVWEEVVIDDRLPTKNGSLIYLHSKDPNEFWSPLLEKAFAKLHGSYKALEGGLAMEAAVDFTGGIPESIDLSHLTLEPEVLFQCILTANQRRAFMSCSLNSNSKFAKEALEKGLRGRHAYSITKVVDVRTAKIDRSIPLVRLRNPHGNATEWRGDWSDNDLYWRCIPKNRQEELGLVFEDDGEFYMNVNRDFLKYFGKIEIVHLTAKEMDQKDDIERKFDDVQFKGMWSKLTGTAGGCGNDSVENLLKNPQYTFSISDPDSEDEEMTCPVIICLSQKTRMRRKELAVGFKIYKCPPEMTELDTQYVTNNPVAGKSDGFVNQRDVSKRFWLPSGTYSVIPSTFNPGEEAEFLLRMFVDKTWACSSDVTDGVKGLSVGGLAEMQSHSVDGKTKVGKTNSWNRVVMKMKTPKEKFNWCLDSKDELVLLNMIMKESST